ncbi:hypothetical protein HPB48_008605 [Haemaphysalis longicornis]|uniref:Uncharacterized protein n=1 Tax=Haemaphysalis longicornis TaxID=44386 RepID=A0A9J6GPT5_HAELO|nr:hypothetical protein HPB48_008605 [Haemaphysalis longicornis]
MDEDSTQETSPPPEDVSGQSQSLHVDDLPDDVLLTVFERLDIKSRVRIERGALHLSCHCPQPITAGVRPGIILLIVPQFSRISQRWQQLARQLWKSQRHLSLVGVFSSRPELPGRCLTPCVLEALLVRCDGCVRTLNLGFATRSLNSEAGAVISEWHLPSVTGVLCGPVGATRVLCPNLENIDISGARLNNTSVQLLAEGCSKLKTAVLMRCTEVDDGGIRKLLGLCKNLELLNLAAMHRLSGECFSEAGTGLRRLLLDGCWGLTMAGLSAIVTKCTSLVELSLSRCIQATDRELELLGQEDLDLSHNRHVTEVAISTICKGCKKLRCLDLTGIHNHAGDAILAALAACSSLRILKVSYAGVTDVGLNAIAHQGQLRSFEVRGCPTVTNEVAEESTGPDVLPAPSCAEAIADEVGITAPPASGNVSESGRIRHNTVMLQPEDVLQREVLARQQLKVLSSTPATERKSNLVTSADDAPPGPPDESGFVIASLDCVNVLLSAVKRRICAMQTTGNHQTVLNDVFTTLNISHRGLHTKTWQGYVKEKLAPAATRAADNVMATSAWSVRKLYDDLQLGNPGNISVTYDGSWMTRGYSSHIGVVIELFTGLVLDFVVLSNFCAGCKRRPKRHNLRYTTILSDGDSRTYLALVDAKVYGLGGKGRLTGDLVTKPRSCYGWALKSHSGDVRAMHKAVMATYHHITSNDTVSNHSLCPPGPDSWCRQNAAKAKREPAPKHEYNLPPHKFKALLPVYERLLDEKLLQHCLQGKTQNSNESLHSIIWALAPKKKHASLFTVQAAVAKAVLKFNTGNKRASAAILKEVDLNPGLPSTKRVQALVKQCSHLHMLDLTGCRLLDNRAVTECNNIVRERPARVDHGDTRVRASRLNLDPKCNLKLDTRNMSADYSEADGWDHMREELLLEIEPPPFGQSQMDAPPPNSSSKLSPGFACLPTGVDDDVWDLELDGEDPVAELAAEAALAAEEALAGGVLPADLPPGMGGGIEEWAPPGYLQDMLDMPPSDDDDWPYDYYDDYGYGYDGPLSDDEGWVQGYYDFDDPHEDDEEDFLDQGGDLGIGGLFHEPREDGGGAPGGAGVADIDHPPANAAGVVHDWGPDIAYMPGDPQVGGNGGARAEDGLEIADLLDDPQEEEQDGYQGGVEIADYLDDPQEEPWTPEGSDYGDYLD